MLSKAKHLPFRVETLRFPTPLRFGGHVAQGDIRLTLSSLLLIAFLLIGCAAPTPPTPTATPTPSIPANCLAKNEDLVSYFNLADGYCLLYPANFRVSDLNSRIANFYGPPLDESIEPVFGALTILIEDAAGGRTLTQVVEDYLRQFGTSAPASRTPTTLGGEAAEIVEGLPGRTGSRQVFLIHNDAVYHFGAYPVDDAFPQAKPQVDAVWQALTASFTFLPPGFAEAFAKCPTGSDSAAPYLNFDQGVCLLYPSLMSISVIDAAQQIEFSGPPHAPGSEAAAVSVFIYSGQAANGRTADQVADDYLARFPADQTASVGRTPITVGGQPGVSLDGAPGLTQTRQAFVVHNDRVYQFTLSPYNDPTLADYQAEAEAAWQMVTTSWVFVSKP
jgi:hypothetical protein